MIIIDKYKIKTMLIIIFKSMKRSDLFNINLMSVKGSGR